MFIFIYFLFYFCIFSFFYFFNKGPGPNDGSSTVWVYHSHVNEVSNSSAGLVGPIIITKKGQARSSSNMKPKDVDREFVTIFWVVNENVSPLISKSVAMYMQATLLEGENDHHNMGHMGNNNVPHKRHDKRELLVYADDPRFIKSNLKNAINGYIYGNMPLLKMKQNDRVRFYSISIGDEIDVHSPHWEGHTLIWHNRRVDTAALLPVSQVHFLFYFFYFFKLFFFFFYFFL